MKNLGRFLTVALVSSLILTSCLGGHKITFSSGEDLVDECPKRAKAGELVTLTTAVVTDADMYVNGGPDIVIETVSDGVYQFVMPDHDVELSITVIANGLA